MMSSEQEAVDALADWMSTRSMKLGWERLAGGSGFSLGLAEPHRALLLASNGEWELHLTTARGVRNVALVSFADSPEALLDGVLFAIFMKATSELHCRDRTASVGLTHVLRVLANETNDKRYSGRAAALLAGHASKDGYERQARIRLEEAIRLFALAGDTTAADTVSSALENLQDLVLY
ncbi:hypothetical protein SAMN06295879_0129 [Agreia bicolorata]|uniref:Uncharacterized protein n=1 Tax=Agreia bicolorata TaxID=110935 RepID=A0A1T4WTA2_9MICO|nr:hypothetical protein [Agreia bicolorata]SKA79831.1 hypothetical protein SAMN06295879_0129 [Agreia bicolorata]